MRQKKKKSLVEEFNKEYEHRIRKVLTCENGWHDIKFQVHRHFLIEVHDLKRF